jgi:integrase
MNDDRDRLRGFVQHLRGKLTDRKVAAIMRDPNAKKKWNDGGGLWLQCASPTARSWNVDYTDSTGKRKTMGLGSLKKGLLLQDARLAAIEAHRMLAEGIDPIEEKRRAKAARKAARKAAANAQTFEEAAADYIEAHAPGWKNAKHIDQWRSSLANDVYPTLGKMPVAAIEIEHVQACLEPIWRKKPTTASRIRGRIEKVLGRAIGLKLRQGPNPARWKDGLDSVLAPPTKLIKQKNHRAMEYADLPAFFGKVANRGGSAARALQFLTLTAARSAEVLGATWDEIDFAKALWTVPGERMKAGRQHQVPLSDAAVALLSALPQGSSGFLFPSDTRPDKPLRDAAMIEVVRAIEADPPTVHGFRSSFSKWARERTSTPSEIIELALAQSVGSGVEKAYARTTLVQKRRDLMAAWAHYLAHGESSANVLPMRKAT